MDKELKQKWVDALESGKYEKGTGQLFDTQEGGFCCLGVLAKELGYNITSDGIGIKEDENSNEPYMYPSLAKSGLTDKDMHALYRLNDSHPSDNFKEVIDFIKTNL